MHPEKSVSQTLLLLEELQFGLQMKVRGDEYLCGCVHEVANAMLFKGWQATATTGNWPKLGASEFLGSEHCYPQLLLSTNSQIHLNPVLLSLISIQDACTVAKTESDRDIVSKKHVVGGCWIHASFWCLDTLRRCMVRTASVSLCSGRSYPNQYGYNIANNLRFKTFLD